MLFFRSLGIFVALSLLVSLVVLNSYCYNIENISVDLVGEKQESNIAHH